jgi:MFS family permease
VMNCLLVVLLEIPLGNWLGKYNKILLVGISCLLAGVGMAILSVATFFWIAILSAIIYTIGEIIFFCFAQYVLYHKAPAHRKGESLGLFRLAFASSRVLGPAAGGYIYHQFGGAYVWYACGLIGIICFIPCYFFRQYD